MLRYAVVAAGGALLTLGALQLATGPAAHAAAEAPLRGSQGESEPAFLNKASDGQFWADAVIDGHEVHVLVDTGASSVSLTPHDAERLGLYMGGLVYDRTVRTVDGDSLAAPVRLRSVSVNGVEIGDVDALVIGRGLPASLLGMSYLGRLSRLEVTPTSLVLTR